MNSVEQKNHRGDPKPDRMLWSRAEKSVPKPNGTNFSILGLRRKIGRGMSPNLRSETARWTEERAMRSPTEKKNQRPAHVGKTRSETNGRQKQLRWDLTACSERDTEKLRGNSRSDEENSKH
jgi:hypothetical protein